MPTNKGVWVAHGLFGLRVGIGNWVVSICESHIQYRARVGMF